MAEFKKQKEQFDGTILKLENIGNLQGVPKVGSSNFIHYNFWSKLYFYMKFLEDVYFSIEYIYSEFQ